MADQPKQDDQTKNQSATGSDTNQAGDPGATPGSAEGDEQIVDESLRQKEKQQK